MELIGSVIDHGTAKIYARIADTSLVAPVGDRAASGFIAWGCPHPTPERPPRHASGKCHDASKITTKLPQNPEYLNIELIDIVSSLIYQKYS